MVGHVDAALAGKEALFDPRVVGRLEADEDHVHLFGGDRAVFGAIARGNGPLPQSAAHQDGEKEKGKKPAEDNS